MASESSVTDQSIDEPAEEKNVGDASKCVDGEEIIFRPKEAAGKGEEDESKEDRLTGMESTASISDEELEPADASVTDVTKKDEQHEKVGEVENSLQESEVSHSSEPAVDTTEGNLQSQADDALETPSEVQERSSDFVEISTSQEPIISESKTEDLKYTEIEPKFENERKPDEAPLFSTGLDMSEDGNVKAEMAEAANPDSSKDKVEMKMIESEDLKNKIQVSVPAEIPTVVAPVVSDVPQKDDIDFGNPTSIEVPVKDLEFESGSPEEQKSKESTENLELNSNLSKIDAEDEVIGSSSYEVEPSEAAELVEKNDDDLEEEAIQISAKNQKDHEAKNESAQTESNENISQGFEIKNDDEIVEGGIETSTVPDDIPSLAKVSSELEGVSEPGVVVEEEDTSLERDKIDTAPKVAEVSLEVGNVLEGDKLVGKDKDVNAEAVERDLVDTITDPTEAEVSSDQVKSPATSEIVNEALEVTSKELNNAPEASEVFFEGDRIPAVDEKSESLDGEAATSVEAPADTTAAEEPLDQVVEEMTEKSEGLKGEAATSVEAPTDVTAAEEPIDQVIEEKNEKSESLKGEAATSVDVPTDATAAEVPLDPVIEEKNESSEGLKGKAATSVEAPTDANAAREPLEEKDEKSESLNGEAETSAEASTDTTTAEEQLYEVADEKDERRESLIGEAATSAEAPTYTTAAEEPLDQFIEDKNEKNVSMKTSLEEPTDTTTAEEPLDQLIEEKNDKSESLKGEAATSVEAPTNATAAEEPLDPVIEEKNEKSEGLIGKAATSVEAPTDATAAGETLEEKDEKSESLKGEAETSAEASTDATTAEEQLDEVVDEKDERRESLIGEAATSAEAPTDTTAAEESLDQVTEEKYDENEILEGEAATLTDASTDTTAAEEPLDQVVEEKNEKSESLEGEAATSVEVPRDTTAAEEPLDQVVATLADASTDTTVAEEPLDPVVEEKNEKSESLEGEAATSVEVPKDTTAAEEPLDQVVEEKKEKSESLKGEAATSGDTPINTTAAEEPLDQVIEDKNEKSGSLKTSLEEPTDNITAEDPLGQLTEEKNDKSESLKGEAATSVEAPTDATAAEEPLDPVIEEKNEKSEGLKGEAATSVEAPTDATAAGEPLEEEDEKSESLNGEAKTSAQASTGTTTAEEQLDEVVDEKDERRERLIGEAATSVEAPTDTTAAEEPLDQVVDEKDGKSESLKDEAATSAEALTDTTTAEEPLDQLVEEKNDKSESLKGEAPTSAEVPRGTTVAEEPLDQLVEENKEKRDSLKGEAVASAKAPIDTIAAEEALDQVVEKKKQKSESVKGESATSAATPTDTTAAEEPLYQVVEDNNEKSESLKTSLEEPTDTTTAEEPLDQLIEDKNDKSESLKGEAATSVEEPTDVTAAEEPLDPVIVEAYEESEVLKGDAATSVETPTDATTAGEPLEEKDEKSESLNGEAEASAEASTDTTTTEEKLDEVLDEKDERRESLIGEAATSAEAPTDTTAAEEPVDQVVEEKDDKSESLKGEAATSAEASTDTTAAEEPLDQVVEEKKEKSESWEGEAATSAEVPGGTTAAEEPLDQVVEKKKQKSESLKGEATTSADTPTNTTAAEEPLDQVIDDKNEKSESLKTSLEEPTDTTTAEEPLDQLIEEKNDKSESLKGEAATSVVAPRDITAAEEPLGQVFEEKSEKSKRLKGEAVTSVEAPTDTTAAPLDQVVEERNGNSVSDTQVSPENKLVVDEKYLNDEAKEINLESQADGAHENPSVEQSDFTEKSASQEPAFSESKTDDLKDVETKLVSENDSNPVEAPLVATDVGISKDGNVGAEKQEATNPGFLKDKVDIELIKSEDFKDEIQLLPAEIPTVVVPDASEAPEKNDIDSSNQSTIQVPVKDLEVESGSPEDHKSSGSAETKEPSSDVSPTNAGGEVVGPSSDDVKPSGVAEVETTQTPVEIHEYLEAKPVFAQTRSDEIFSEGINVKKDDKIVDGMEISAVPDDISPLTKVSYEEENTSEPGGDKVDTVLKVADVAFKEGNLLEENKLFEQEKANAGAVERDLVDTITDPAEAEVSSVQVKAPETTEIANDALEVSSKELDITSEASEVPYDSDKFSAGDEKSESLKGEVATSVETPKDTTTAEEPLDQVVQEKNKQSSINETQVPSEDKLVDRENDVKEEAKEINEVSSEQVIAPTTTEIVNEALEVTSREFNIVPEASEVSTEVGKVSVGDEEKSKSLIVGESTSAEAPKDITAVKELLDPMFEEKIDSPVSDLAAPTEGKLVDQEKNVNVKDEEGDFINTSTDAIAAEASSEQIKSPEIVEVESDKQALEETSKELTIASEASEVPFAGEEKSESLTVDATTSVEAPKDITTVEESLDQVIDKKNENSITEKKALLEGILVEKEKNPKEEAEEKDLVDTSTDTSAADVYSDQIKASETAEIIKEDSNTQASEVTSKELNITPEASDVHSDGDEVFASEAEKRESLKGEDSTLVEASEDIKIVEDSPDQVIKQKSESSKRYVEDEQRDLIDTSTDAIAAEVSSEQEKAPEIAEEKTNKQALEETSKELNIAPEDSKVPAEDDKLSSSEEKSESLRVEAETSVETPKDITTVKELLGQVIEKKKSDSSVSENKDPTEDKLVDKEKDVNAEAEERELVDSSTDPTAAEVASDQLKPSETAENIKENSNKQALEVASKELNITSEAIDIPSKCDEVSAGDEEKRESLKGEDAIVEASKDITIAEELPDQVMKQKSESSKSELVGKEKDVNADAEKTNLHDTSTDPTAAETAEVKKEESNKQSSEVTSIPDACEVPSEGDKVSSGEEEKIESFKGEDATSLKVPEDTITPEKSVDQLIEENKSESSKNEPEAPIETTRDLDTSMLFPEAVKDIIASEEVKEKQDEASNDLDVVENKASDSENRKEEVKVEEEELGAEKAESEKSKDQGPIVSSDSADAKPTKEVSKRESNIFSKVKRSFVKAKKAILGKPSSHNSSSEAKK